MLKIIGKTKENLIVVMSESDLEMLTGNYYHREKTRYDIGEEFNVDGIFRHVTDIENNKVELNKVADSLRRMADRLTKDNAEIIEKLFKPEAKA